MFENRAVNVLGHKEPQAPFARLLGELLDVTKRFLCGFYAYLLVDFTGIL